MADKYYWIGSHGPFIYDDTSVYPDGKPHAAIHGEVGHTTEVPVDDSDIANKKYVDDSILAGGDVSWPIGVLFFGAVATSPTTLLGFGTWLLMGTGNLTLT